MGVRISIYDLLFLIYYLVHVGIYGQKEQICDWVL
jgi:hypothetical protein